MSGHKVRRRAGRYQCEGCRAAWAEPDGHRGSQTPCPGIPLPHGFKREHVVYPTWSRQTCEEVECDLPWCDGVHGPDAYCDDIMCPCMRHSCDCDVDTGKIEAPGLNVLRDSHEDGDERLSRRDAGAVA